MDTSKQRKYSVRWSTTETFFYDALVDAETMASMLGVPVAEVEACGDDVDCVRDLGIRGLENGLADIEDDDVEDADQSATLEREVEGVGIVHV